MPDFMLEATPLAALAVLLFACLGFAACAAIATQTTARMLPGSVLGACAEAGERITAVELSLDRWQVQITTRLEDMEALDASIARHRKQLQGVESQLRQREQMAAGQAAVAEEDQGTRLARLRAQVYARGPGG